MKLGDVEINYLGHDGFLIVYDGKRIAVDPYKISDSLEKVDLILVTHSHYDHCSIEDISKISREGTNVVVTADSQSKVNRVDGINIRIIYPGLKIKVDGIDIYGFPAYNKDKDFHPRDEGWVGYLLKLGDVIIYHAGDTDKIDEMHGLNGINVEGEKVVALLPVSGKYVMTAEEAAEAADVIKPYLAIPMHYGEGVAGTGEDAKRFVEICNEKGLQAEVLKKYGGN